MLNFLLFFYFLFSFSQITFGGLSTVILENGKENYEIGLNLEFLEDPTGKLTIDDINEPKWASKFIKSKTSKNNYKKT